MNQEEIQVVMNLGYTAFSRSSTLGYTQDAAIGKRRVAPKVKKKKRKAVQASRKRNRARKKK